MILIECYTFFERIRSFLPGGAAERAGLHAGDKIIKVNGVNVMQSTHTEVVALIKCKYLFHTFKCFCVST